MADYDKLLNIQLNLKVPKDQKGRGYKYRNTEQILQTVKPLCYQQGVLFTLSDRVENVGERYYVVSTATLISIGTGETIAMAQGWAREGRESRMGMDEAQITGSASSYARKRALCGLFDIDDEEDNDALPNVSPVRGATKEQKKEIGEIRKSLIDALKGRKIAPDDFASKVFHKGFLELSMAQLSESLNRLDNAVEKYNKVSGK